MQDIISRSLYKEERNIFWAKRNVFQNQNNQIWSEKRYIFQNQNMYIPKLISKLTEKLDISILLWTVKLLFYPIN